MQTVLAAIAVAMTAHGAATDQSAIDYEAFLITSTKQKGVYCDKTIIMQRLCEIKSIRFTRVDRGHTACQRMRCSSGVAE